jgi:hypothetical protein
VYVAEKLDVYGAFGLGGSFLGAMA